MCPFTKPIAAIYYGSAALGAALVIVAGYLMKKKASTHEA